MESNRPDHLKGPEWNGWDDIYEPAPIVFIEDKEHHCQQIMIGQRCVGWLERRPHYCDRGHWKFGCELPDLDGADSFPRYYMSETLAKLEIMSWLNWRLWRADVS